MDQFTGKGALPLADKARQPADLRAQVAALVPLANDLVLKSLLQELDVALVERAALQARISPPKSETQLNKPSSIGIRELPLLSDFTGSIERHLTKFEEMAYFCQLRQLVLERDAEILATPEAISCIRYGKHWADPSQRKSYDKVPTEVEARELIDNQLADLEVERIRLNKLIEQLKVVQNIEQLRAETNAAAAELQKKNHGTKHALAPHQLEKLAIELSAKSYPKIKSRHSSIMDLANKLFTQYASLVFRTLKGRRRHSPEEQIQSLAISLRRIILRYNPLHTAGFLTFAIVALKKESLRKEPSRLIETPIYDTRIAYRQIEAARQHYSEPHPTIEQIAFANKLSIKDAAASFRLARDASRKVLSTSPSADDESGLDLADSVRETRPDLAAELSDEASDLRSQLRQLRERMPPQWAEILKMRFGLEDHSPMTLADVGDVLGLSRERIRQLEVKALRLAKWLSQQVEPAPEADLPETLAPASKIVATRSTTRPTTPPRQPIVRTSAAATIREKIVNLLISTTQETPLPTPRALAASLRVNLMAVRYALKTLPEPHLSHYQQRPKQNKPRIAPVGPLFSQGQEIIKGKDSTKKWRVFLQDSRGELLNELYRDIVKPLAERVYRSRGIQHIHGPWEAEQSEVLSRCLERVNTALSLFRPTLGRDLKFYVCQNVKYGFSDYLRSKDPLPRSARKLTVVLNQARETFIVRYGRPAVESGIFNREIEHQAGYPDGNARLRSIEAIELPQSLTNAEFQCDLDACGDSDPSLDGPVASSATEIKELLAHLAQLILNAYSDTAVRAFLLTDVFGLTLRAVGQIEDLTESRICQILADVHTALPNYENALRAHFAATPLDSRHRLPRPSKTAFRMVEELIPLETLLYGW